MSKEIYASVNGVAREVKKMYAPVNGVARKVKKAYKGVNGVAKQFFEAGFSADFAKNTWGDIIAACQTRTVPATWVVGDRKTMVINNVEYWIDIIGINHDTYADYSGKAPLTFQLHDIYGTLYQMYNTAKTTNGWTDCTMRTVELPAIFATMPASVQAGIKEVNKLTCVGGMSAMIGTTSDKLFLLSEMEVTGYWAFSREGEGQQYAYYAQGNSMIKQETAWWTRSPTFNTVNKYRVIDSAGRPGDGISNEYKGVSFAFCF